MEAEADVSDRFIVVSVLGYGVNPRASRSSGGGQPPTRSFSVLDTGWNYKLMGEFNTTNGAGRHEARQRERAQEFCDELNAWHDRLTG